MALVASALNFLRNGGAAHLEKERINLYLFASQEDQRGIYNCYTGSKTRKLKSNQL
jgi:hypothetical protein